ncbi:hypothetical protein GCM10011496_22500 [Polaromonas eurypsychrophila]|uniref:Uncharacterized protein n=1 Tax=Polaromonas eurypsychrophila TaxID=1614635 RepID=A0A916SJR1_9BURK|nr:hypothetical protein GCM10011496_22500 [Polaromonas eurypsychrophila]
MHCAQPRNLRTGQRKRAGEERTKTGAAHKVRQLRAQFLKDQKRRRKFYIERFIPIRLMSNETLGEIPHLWSSAVHW